MIGPLYVRIRTLLLGALAAALLALPAIPAGADTGNSSANLTCKITFSVDNHPGVTPELQLISSTSHGLTGTATCTGTVDGQPVTGPGQFKVTSQLVANCTSATGHGEFVLRIPTTVGIRTVAGTFESSNFMNTGDLTGTARIISAVGDCFTTPITSVTVVEDVHIT